MSNVSIFEKKWIDLVFEGKNKEYGAYQLRQESPRTTIAAFFFGLVFIGLISGIGLLFSSFNSPSDNEIPTITPDSVIRVDLIEPPTNREEEKLKIKEPEVKPEPPALVPTNPNIVVVTTTLADPVVPITNELPQINTPSGGVEGGTGTTPTIPTSGGNGEGEGEGEGKNPNKVVLSTVLDAQPEFPGGMKKFYAYVGDNFEKQEIDGEESLTVHVSFVIEKDGSMTDIKVLRNPGYGLDKEAIRVLKSLKTKWKPGILNGQSVRTQYTLPITVMLN